MDGRPACDRLNSESEDSDHIPFWAGWETSSYIVVDQEAFEKAKPGEIIYISDESQPMSQDSLCVG